MAGLLTDGGRSRGRLDLLALEAPAAAEHLDSVDENPQLIAAARALGRPTRLLVA
jgi:hypothetical protein